jgi:CysZ protein
MKRNFFNLLLLGYKNYWRGIKFLLQHHLYGYVIFPLVLFAAVNWVGSLFDAAGQEAVTDAARDIEPLQSLNALTWFTAKLLFLDSMYVVFTKFALYIVMIILSPVLSILSEKIEEKLTGNKYRFRFMQLVHDVQRGAKIALRNIIWEYFFIVLVLGLASLFGDSVKAALIFSIPVMFGFYFYGFSFIDYINERRRLNIQQSVYFVSNHKGLAVAIGSIYSVFFLSYHAVLRQFDTLSTDTTTQLIWGTVLVITFLLAVIAPIIAIASATLSMHELVDLGKNKYAEKAGENAAEA